MKTPSVKASIMGTGALLFVVVVKGSMQWDGHGVWLAAGDTHAEAKATIAAQYSADDFDESADWTVEQIGDFA